MCTDIDLHCISCEFDIIMNLPFCVACEEGYGEYKYQKKG